MAESRRDGFLQEGLPLLMPYPRLCESGVERAHPERECPMERAAGGVALELRLLRANQALVLDTCW